MASDIIKRAILTLEMEGNAIHNLAKNLDSRFEDVVKLILTAPGRVVITGVGKSADIGRKIVATLNATGSPALFVHAGDAVHGDLGGIQSGDVVLCLSKSGRSEEILSLVPHLKTNKFPLVAITGVLESPLAIQADHVLLAGDGPEACPYDLAPTTSTAVQMALGDALAMCLMEARGFSEKDFARFHPGGTLGKKLSVKLIDIVDRNRTPQVFLNYSLQDILLSMTTGRHGATVVVDSSDSKERNVVGIITDGDIRRSLESNLKPETQAAEIMNSDPFIMKGSELGSKAADLIIASSISQVIIIDDDSKYVGIVHIHELMKEGLVK